MSAPDTQGGVCSSGVATAIPSAPPPTARTTTSRATTTLFLARRRALRDLHPWSRGELTVLTDDLRRIRAEVGTRLSAGNRGRGTGWQSLTDVAAEVREWLAAYSPPPEVTVSVWDDTAGLAVKRMRTILRNVVIGVVLVFALLILVLDLRVAVWVALGIPLAFVGSLRVGLG